MQPSIFSLAAAVCVADTHKHAACPSLRALHTAVVSCLRYADSILSRERNTSKIILGLVAVTELYCAGLVSTQAKAVATIPVAKQQSLAEEVRWRRARVRRGYVGRPVVRRSVARRPVRRTWRRATRPLRWIW